jgi:hypothetical protein
MSESRTNVLTQGLLDAARQDGPGAAERSRIWEGIALAPQLSVVGAIGAESARSGAALGSAASAKAVGSAITGGLSVGKLLLAGAIAGSALTVGLGVFLMRGPLHEHAATLAPNHGVSARGVSPNARDLGAPITTAGAQPGSALPATVDIDDTPGPAAVATTVDTPVAQTVAPASSKGVHTRHVDTPREVPAGDLLMREAALVSNARTEVVAGRATSALELLDAAARSGSHSLEPEEMALRVRALRLLGRDGEADRVEETLKARYPGSYLSH